MSQRKRKSFSSDFKAKVALEAIHGVKTLNEIAQEFGVHPVLLSGSFAGIALQSGGGRCDRTNEGRLEAKINRDKVFALREQGLGATDIARQMKIRRSTVYVILQEGMHDRAGKEESDG